MRWQHLDTGIRTASANMALDAALLLDLQNGGDCVLHLYDWERDSVTHGCFIDPQNFLHLPGVQKNKLELAKRPTGGGIVFHNCDLAFSVLIPADSPYFSTNPLENYAFVNNRVVWAIKQMIGIPAELLPEEPTPPDEPCKNFCMAKSTKYDVMIQGKKIGGAAQRKTRYGFLHQGSISIGFLPTPYLEEVLVSGTRVVEGIRQNSFSLLGDTWTTQQLKETRLTLRSLLQKAFSDTYEG